MSQLHQEALRKQVVVDKRNMTDLSLLLQKEGHNMITRRNTPSVSSRSTHSVNSPFRSSQSNAAGHMHSSSGTRIQEVIITDPYLDALTKETRARTNNRLSSTDYMMQW